MYIETDSHCWNLALSRGRFSLRSKMVLGIFEYFANDAYPIENEEDWHRDIQKLQKRRISKDKGDSNRY